IGPGEDGRGRERRLAEGARLRRRVGHCRVQRLAPGADVPRQGRVMYARILVPLEHAPADETILAHVRDLARRLGSSLVLIHVADGWVARNIKELDLRESEEMREDRAYLEQICGRLQDEGLDVEEVLAAGVLDKAIDVVALLVGI